MLEEIKKIKGDVLRFMEQEVGKYGNGRMDTKQVGDLADVVKDLSEAEYYCTVAEAMGQGSQGYTRPMDDMMGYGGYGRMGYSGGQGGGSRGGGGGGGSTGSMGHVDAMAMIRDMLANVDPATRKKIRDEVFGM